MCARCLLPSAATETRHIRVFVIAVSEAKRKKRIGNTTRQANNASMTSTHNLCECERERVLCASRSMRLPFAKCSLFTGVCARELDDFAFVIISVFANSFNFLYWPMLLLSQTAFILVDNEAKRRQMASLMRAPSKQHDQTSESKKANR